MAKLVIATIYLVGVGLNKQEIFDPDCILARHSAESIRQASSDDNGLVSVGCEQSGPLTNTRCLHRALGYRTTRRRPRLSRLDTPSRRSHHCAAARPQENAPSWSRHRSRISISTTPLVEPRQDALEDLWDDDTEELESRQLRSGEAEAAEVQTATMLAVVALLKSTRAALYVIAGLLGIAVLSLIFSGRG